MEQNFIHWYFDNQRNIFDKCNEVCNTCNGPNDNNCLTCNNENLYAYNGRCLEDCPTKTFKSYDDEGNNICEKCYINCATCNTQGDSGIMKCLNCFDYQIKN